MQEMNVVAYNRAIGACTKSQDWRHVAVLLGEMVQLTVEADVITYSSAMNACSKAHRWSLALWLFGESRRATGGNVITYGNAISACEKGHQWPAAVQLLLELQMKKLQSNVIVFSAAISACEKAGEWPMALALLGECQVQQVEANSIAYSAAISACEKGQKWPEALHLLTLARSCTSVDVVMYNAVISAMEAWTWALALLQQLQEEKLHPTVISFNSCLATMKGGAWRRALCVFEEMVTSQLKATLISYNSLISSLGSSYDSWQKALTLLELMELMELRPNARTYTAAMSACEQGECWDGALALLALIPVPDLVAYGSALSCCQRRWRRALTLLEQLQWRGLEPNFIIYSAAIAACEKGEEWQMALHLLSLISTVDSVVPFNSALSACEKCCEWTWALELLRCMEKSGLPDQISFSAAIRACDRAPPCLASAWRWHCVLQLLQQLTESSLKLDAVTCTSCVSACQKGGRCQDVLTLLAAQDVAGLELLKPKR